MTGSGFSPEECARAAEGITERVVTTRERELTTALVSADVETCRRTESSQRTVTFERTLKGKSSELSRPVETI